MDFHFPSEGYFSCTSCGKCCSSGFEIPVQTEKAERIKSTEFHAARVRDGYQPLPVLAETFHYLGYDERDRCLYFEDDKCGLHHRYGLSHKPVICQLYPFNLVNTPRGMHVSLLFSCPAVLAGVGAPVASHAEELQQLFARNEGRVPQLPALRDHILVTQYQTVTWPEYLEIEAQILEGLDLQDPVGSLLRASCWLLEGVGPVDKPALLGAVQDTVFPQLALTALQFVQGTESTFEYFRPTNSLVREVMGRYLRNQLHGKLLLSGPSLVCRLLLVACGLWFVLRRLKAEQESAAELHFSFEALKVGFEICEERIVAQSDELDPLLTEMEDVMMELAFGEGETD